MSQPLKTPVIPRDKLQFVQRTKHAIRFGWKNLLYARSIKTGNWTSAYDKGVWTTVNNVDLWWELDKAYAAWLKEASDAEIKAAEITRDGKPLDPMFIRCLRTANASPDGTVLCIGYGRHNPEGHMKSYPTASANALLDREFLEFVKNAAWGDVYRITDAGRRFMKSYDKA